MRVKRDGYDANGSIVSRRGWGALAGRGVFRRRRGHRAQTAHGRPLRARDHRGGRVTALARLFRGILRARASAASHARECGGPRYQGTLTYNYPLLVEYKRLKEGCT